LFPHRGDNHDRPGPATDPGVADGVVILPDHFALIREVLHFADSVVVDIGIVLDELLDRPPVRVVAVAGGRTAAPDQPGLDTVVDHAGGQRDVTCPPDGVAFVDEHRHQDK
jgi:hypothetical protein